MQDNDMGPAGALGCIAGGIVGAVIIWLIKTFILKN